ncbi:thioredoxin domain-containing protein [Streptomyces sp. NPDC001941]|uniref:DsbA family protein n=1 Tax=Streptomyces sp. NPDC001941 TaxID=3154659 RepID=UPI00332E1AAE
MVLRRPRRAAAALVVAVALGVSVAACSSGGSGGGGTEKTAADLPVKPAGDTALLAKLPSKADGAKIVVGDPKAPHTVTVHEDARCPFCARFEKGGATALAQAAAAGKVKVEYVIASFLDRNLGGSGSVNAANALRAAADSGTGNFARFHAALFAAQPEDEATDAYTPDFLLKIADQVEGLRGAAFDKAVRTSAYKDWVAQAEKAFEGSGHDSTPTVLIDGKKPADQNALYDAAAFGKALTAAGVK